jgi:hypothetical protein
LREKTLSQEGFEVSIHLAFLLLKEKSLGKRDRIKQGEKTNEEED